MKLATFPLLAGLAFATAAEANINSFGFGERLERRSTLNLGLVRAEADGIVEIYDHRRGTAGALLGTTRVRGGANHDVRVTVGRPPLGDVLAILKVGGQVVAQKDYDVDRDRPRKRSRNRAGVQFQFQFNR